MRVARVIPCLDVDAGRVVKGVNFVGIRDAGDPVELGARYDLEGADELIFLDITASSDNRETIVELASHVAEEVFIPFTVGGGVRTVEDARRLLRVGADKVAVNSAAVERPELLTEIADEFGVQCVVVAIDARRASDSADARRASDSADARRASDSADVRRASDIADARRAGEELLGSARGAAGGPSTRDAADIANTLPSGFEVYVHGGRTPTGIDAVEWAKEATARGAGEIMLTSMDRDGTRDGFDLALTKAVVDAVNVPVIASGGVGNLDHLAEAVLDAGADAVLAASIFHFGEYTVAEAKQAMADAGITVRPVERR